MNQEQPESVAVKALAPEWYAWLADRKQGPFSVRAIRRKIRFGSIIPTTKLWCEEMGNWQPASTTIFVEALTKATAKQVLAIERRFRRWWGLLVTAALLFVYSTFTKVYALDETLILIGALVGLTSCFYLCLLQVRLWCVLWPRWTEEGSSDANIFALIVAATSCSLFVPFCLPLILFCSPVLLFWLLARDLNRYAAERQLGVRPANQWLAITATIATMSIPLFPFCFMSVPNEFGKLFAYLSLGYPVVAAIIAVFAMRNLSITAIAILQSPGR